MILIIPNQDDDILTKTKCFEVRVRDPRQLEAGNDDKESVEQFYRN